MEGGTAIKLSAKEGPSEEDTLRSACRKLFSSKDIREIIPDMCKGPEAGMTLTMFRKKPRQLEWLEMTAMMV